MIFSNFSDDDGVLPLIPERLREYIGNFYFIPGSLKTNRGLIELSKWIKLPITAARRRMYADKFREADEGLRDLSEKLTITAKLFQSEAIARSHMPEIRTKPPPQPAVATAQSAAIDQEEGEMNDKEFWGESAQKRKGPLHKRRKVGQPPPEVKLKAVETKPKVPPVRRQQASDARADVLPRVDYDMI